ncbi:MAG: SGNH/GDSL hydrolase family protein [Lachnospiraceae bacterium]|nr:SGNH/GDSL hydrolase family protein [Lachnospiraceae bacterium]
MIMKEKVKINYHLLILAVIAAIFALGIFILLRWNRGVDSNFDPDFFTTEFDVEALDLIMFMNPALTQGREDDGELQILCLGNNPFTDELGENGLAALIARETGGITYNGAFPNSKIVCNPNAVDLEDSFSLYYVTMALVNKNFSHLQNAASKISDRRFADAVDTLASIDMQKIDVLVIMYDTTDYNELSPAHNPNNDHDLNAFTGALRVSMEHIKKFFPHIRIIFMSHSYAQYLDENGELHNGIMTDLGNGTVTHYLIMGYDVAISTGFTFIDNFFGTIHEENYHDYMIDHMHYNDAGRLMLAERVARVILEE